MSDSVKEARKLLEDRRRELREELRRVEGALRGLGAKRRGRPPKKQ
jgi:hypothetical protein